MSGINKIGYLHELSDAEFNVVMESEKTWRELLTEYAQPHWCGYPNAIAPLGCWSLLGKAKEPFRIRSEADCLGCSMWMHKGTTLDNIIFAICKCLHEASPPPTKILLNPAYTAALENDMRVFAVAENVESLPPSMAGVPVEFDESVETYKVLTSTEKSRK